MIRTIDYLDEDVAYLLGLIIARGTFIEASGDKRLIITFPFKNLEAIGIEKSYAQRDSILLSFYKITRRLGELIGEPPEVVEQQNRIDLVFKFKTSSMVWRNLRFLTRNKTDHFEFEIPEEIFKAPKNIQKEFMRGYADVAGTARWANRDQRDRARIYLDVLNRNWKLPVQICHLLQDYLEVPVNTIAWGHPNVRDPNLRDYNAGRTGSWAREHQIKIYAEAFEKIGFYIEHKQEILNELADYNKEHFKHPPKFCDPTKNKKLRLKPSHPEENSDKLPEEIRGKHYDAYWQICCDLGCYRCKGVVRQAKLCDV